MDGTVNKGVPPQAGSGCQPTASARERSSRSGIPNAERRAINLAYGLLWHMRIDTRDPNLCLARMARTALLLEMTKDEQAAGIAAAREQFQ